MLGVTFSAAEDLRKWRDEVGLQCDLLSDADRAVGLAWGAAETSDQEKARRMSVLVGPDGNVVKVYRGPDVEHHAREVLDDLNARIGAAASDSRSFEGEVRHLLECAADDDMAAKRARFLEASRRLREKTRGRKHTPSEVLIREDRDRGHRDDF